MFGSIFYKGRGENRILSKFGSPQLGGFGREGREVKK
jgi:hypothetical protein